MNAHAVVRVHTVLAVVWFALALATTGWAIYDPENRYLLAWVIFMSGYANVAAHLAGRPARRPVGRESRGMREGARMSAILGAALLAFTALGPAEAPWCGMARLTGYVRTEHGPRTYDGTPILTSEPIAAASWDVRLGSYVEIPDVGVFRIADRGGGLGNGTPMPWVDVAVWSRAEAYALTGVRRVCFRRPAS